jgi:hypothetical protein
MTRVSLFSKSFVIVTDCPQEEFIRVLAENVEPRRLFRLSNGKPYQGEVSAVFFRITRIIKYNNPWLPVTTGRVMTCGNETRIHVEMKLAGAINVFFAYASVVLALVYSTGTLIYLIRHGFAFTLLDVLAPLTFIAPLSCALGFHVEAAVSQRFLCKLALGAGL